MFRAPRTNFFHPKPPQFFSQLQQARALSRRVSFPRAKPRHNGKTAPIIKAAMLGTGSIGTVALALSQPITTSLPESQVKKATDAWGEALKADTIDIARQAAWMENRMWLESYFLGPVIDEGPLDADILVYPGTYVLAADTKVFWVPNPEGETTAIPTVCLSVNGRLGDRLPRGNYYNEVEQLNEAIVQLQGHKLFDQLAPRLDQWRSEGRFERCCVIMRHIDCTAYMVYQDGEFHNFDPNNPSSADQSSDDHDVVFSD